jgi:hypothetical protein
MVDRSAMLVLIPIAVLKLRYRSRQTIRLRLVALARSHSGYRPSGDIRLNYDRNVLNKRCLMLWETVSEPCNILCGNWGDHIRLRLA